MNPGPGKSRLSSLAALLLITVTVFGRTSFTLVKEALVLTQTSNLVFVRFGLIGGGADRGRIGSGGDKTQDLERSPGPGEAGRANAIGTGLDHV